MPHLLLPLLAATTAIGSVTVHNGSDCCCINLPDRSAKNLVDTVAECVASCQANPTCHAAVVLDVNVKHQCDIAGPVPPGKKCCLHKGHFDTMHAGGAMAAIDMGTSTGPCPKPPPPPPPPPPPADTLPAEALRPLFHYTRLTGEMNDPNGLQWRRLPDGSAEYHMFHQHSDSSCQGFDHTGSHAWGHARSPDLVHWQRMNNSGVCGSTSGGVTVLPSDLPPGHPAAGWKGAILVSAPSMNAIGNESVGLHLYTSSDEHLESWSRYQPIKPSPNGDDCVICPSLVPDSTHAGNIGDTFIFAEPAWDKPLPAGVKHRTFYVLSGSNVCPDGDHWCGYGKGTPQSLLFSSTDLVTWTFKSVFWKGPFGHAHSGSLYTPDTFALADGRQALIYLMGGTQWQIGSWSSTTGAFVSEPGKQNEGSEPGLGSCGQSLTDEHGRRVQFGWQHVGVPGAPYTGAQSLPRVITAAPAADGGGLRFHYLPDLESLHDNVSHSLHNVSGKTVGTGVTMLTGIDQQTGLHHHARITLGIPRGTASKFSLCVLCSVNTSGVSVAVIVSATGTVTVGLAESKDRHPLTLPTSATAASLSMDLFLDGALLELFINGGAVQPQATSVKAASAAGVGVMSTAAGAVASVEIWRMRQSVF